MKKIKRIREIKSKIKILSETKVSKETKHEKEIENFVEDSPSIPTPQRSSPQIQNVPQPIIQSIQRTVSPQANAELENQSRNFYTSGLAAREERRNYVSQAPRINLENRGGGIIRKQTLAELDTSRNFLQETARQEIFGDGGEIKYYQAGKREKKSVTDYGE